MKLQFGFRRRLPLLYQSEVHECGLLSLAMVAGYHGLSLDVQALRSAGWAQRTVRLPGLMALADRHGLQTRALKVALEDLPHLRCPAILHWDLRHYLVLRAVRHGRLILHDPAQGQRRMPLAAASPHFSGVALELWPGADFQAGGPPPRLRLRALLGRRHGLVSAGLQLLGLSVLLQLLLLLGPLHVQWLVDGALARGDADLLNLLALGFALVVLLRLITELVRGVLVMRIGHELALRLGQRVVEHLLRLPVVWFQRRRTGDILSRLGSLEPLRVFLTDGFVVVLVDGLLAALALVMLAWYSLPLMLLVLAFCCLYLGWRLLLLPAVRRRLESQVVAGAQQEAALLETLESMESLKLLGQEPARFRQWQRLQVDALNESLGLVRLRLAADGGHTVLFGFQHLLLLTLAGREVLSGGLSLGMLFAFLSYQSQFNTRFADVLERVLALRTLGVHLDRLADLMLAKPEPALQLAAPVREPAEPLPAGRPQPPAAGGGFRAAAPLVADRLVYGHSEAQPLLNGITLSLAPGEFVAIVGPSGSGKSTLLLLLSALLMPASGTLRYGAATLSGPRAVQFRQLIGMVRQQDRLFPGSLERNLMLDAPPDPRRLAALLAAVGLAELPEQLPLGLATDLAALKGQLSGGQLQRLYLVRALYRQPRILLLDEVTAHLDECSRDEVLCLLRALPVARVLVTHDPAVARRADRVLELRDGRLRPAGIG